MVSAQGVSVTAIGALSRSEQGNLVERQARKVTSLREMFSYDSGTAGSQDGTDTKDLLFLRAGGIPWGYRLGCRPGCRLSV